MKLTDYIVSFFEKQDIKYIFGFQGGLIANLIDSISNSKSITYIQCYHEQSTAMAAEGYARETEIYGVAVASSGPGATNLITGIANAYFDSIPVIYITGNVNTFENKKGKLRQLSCQETDIISIVKSITKYAAYIDDASKIRYELEKAVAIATEGRKGPVVLDIPNNVQRAIIDVSNLARYTSNYVKPVTKSNKITIICETLKAAKRPLILCGGGVASNYKIRKSVEEFLAKTELPYVVSLMGKGGVDEENKQFVGMIGSYANRCANITLVNADVVLALGSRLDSRQTGNKGSDYLKKIKFIQIDVDNEVLKEDSIKNKITYHCDIFDFLEEKDIKGLNLFLSKDWLQFISNIKELYSHDNEIKKMHEKTQPYLAMKKILSAAENDTVFTIDIGQNQQWSGQMLRLKKNQKFFNAGAFAPMGYALHAAIGVAFASPNKHIMCIIGDGGFHIALQALLLISQYKLKITVFVLNNHSLGLITQFQTLYYNSNMPGTIKQGGYEVPDIKYIAKATHLKYHFTDECSNFELPELQGGEIIEMDLPELTIVVPKLEFDKSLYNMMPYLDDKEINDIKPIIN